MNSYTLDHYLAHLEGNCPCLRSKVDEAINMQQKQSLGNLGKNKQSFGDQWAT